MKISHQSLVTSKPARFFLVTGDRSSSGDQRSGFTLIELIVAIAISTIILGAVYFSLNSALESWQYSRDQLGLQQVVSTVLDDVLEGTDWAYGLRSAVEVTRAWENQVIFIPPWTEEQPVTGGRRSFQLTQYIRLGAGLPAAELRLPESEKYRPIPVTWDDPDNQTERPRVKPAYELVPGSTVRFSYHPDPDRVPDAAVTMRWDAEDQQLIRERLGSQEVLGTNLFGVQLSECRFRYYDQLDALIVETGDVSDRDLLTVTAVEVELTGRLGEHTLTLRGMMMLRNSPRQSGLIILREGLRVPIPASRAIKTLTVTNIVGIDHEDEIQVELRPRVGRIYRVTLRFERYGKARALLAQATIEYPPGHPLVTDRPRTSSDLGWDFLTAGQGGLYDYDDDPNVEDAVLLEEEPVMLTVEKLDVAGAALFVQP